MYFFGRKILLVHDMTKILSKIKKNRKNIFKMIVSGGVLLFTLLVYLPCDNYFNNITEFNYPIGDFLPQLIAKLLIGLIILGVLGVFVGTKAADILMCVFLGLTLCVISQYMFMNQNLGLMIGDEVNWNEYTLYGLITLGVWLVILALPFIYKKVFKNYGKIFTALSAFLGGVQLLSVIILAFTAGSSAFYYRNDSLDGREQYTVSGKKNIVTFVFDAADNIFFDEILESNPEAFDGLEDFTLYRNTCSVHDYTLASMTQMLAGAEGCPMYDTDSWLKAAWSGKRAEDFYKRLHDADYTVNAFMRADVPIEYLSGKIDNAAAGVVPQRVDKGAIEADLLKLSLYRGAPFLLKRFVDISDVDLKGHVTFSPEFYFFDDEYKENLMLEKSDSDKNYFIIEHLNGPHPPCEDKIAETVNCLEIVKKYIGQMKEMGIYENSSIIITSDHGRHTSNFSDGAATPIFMIKSAGESFDKMKISDAPVYHEDLLATYLYEAGLYDNSDMELYGGTVFDCENFPDRERIWYDHTADENYPNPKGAACNVYYAYKYTGSKDDLKEAIDEKRPYEIIVKE